MPPAAVVYLMGPSGVGKDSLLRFARARIAGAYPIAFAHRYITRPPTPDDENHIALSEPEFEMRVARGLFAMNWRAHGLRYGIGIEIEHWRKAGFVVVVSGSRRHFEASLQRVREIVPVLVTANAEAIAARLAARGREHGADLRERLQRESVSIEHPRLVALDNSGPIEHAGQRLVDLLISLAAP